MSTITKQWLQQKISEIEATRDEIPFGLDEDDSNTLAALRIALASLEAEPVAWKYRIVELKTGKPYAWNLTSQKSEATQGERYKVEVVALFSAPPAPVVPDEKPMPEASKMHAIDAVAAIAEVRDWNACRDAMLQGAEHVSNRDELPVEPKKEV